MNWKLRLLNPATIISLIIAAGALIYEILAILDVTPWLTQDQFTNLVSEIVGVVFTVLVALGIVVDPTTTGIGDSALAMSYVVPYCDYYGTQEIPVVEEVGETTEEESTDPVVGKLVEELKEADDGGSESD